MYEIGIASRNKARLAAGAMLLHSAGIRGSSGNSLVENGKPSATFGSWLSGSAGSLHVQDGKAFGGNLPRKEGKYQVGFFNLDDPAGLFAFAQTMGERATLVRKMEWTLRRINGGYSDYSAKAVRNAIVVGCSVTTHATIGEMIRAIERDSQQSWSLRDNAGHRNDYLAYVEVGQKRLRVSDIIVTLEQLREMYAATA